MLLLKKITHGFVIQVWDVETGKFLRQEFIAGDDVVYENENGEVVDETEPNYEPYSMVQPD